MKIVKEIGKALWAIVKLVLSLGLFTVKLTGFIVISTIIAFTGIQNMLLFWTGLIAYKIIRKMLRNNVGGTTVVTQGEYGPITTTKF